MQKRRRCRRQVAVRPERLHAPGVAVAASTVPAVVRQPAYREIQNEPAVSPVPSNDFVVGIPDAPDPRSAVRVGRTQIAARVVRTEGAARVGRTEGAAHVVRTEVAARVGRTPRGARVVRTQRGARVARNEWGCRVVSVVRFRGIRIQDMRIVPPDAFAAAPVQVGYEGQELSVAVGRSVAERRPVGPE